MLSRIYRLMGREGGRGRDREEGGMERDREGQGWRDREGGRKR